MIPIYNREDCLTITLELIAKNPTHKDYYYLFVADVGHRSGVTAIARQWLRTHQGKVHMVDASQARSPVKQSYAVWQGYVNALAIADNYVYMVEDDIAVSNQFFAWHSKILETVPSAKLSIATKQRDIPYPFVVDHTGYILRSDYQSLGVCWRKASLAQVLALFTPAYWGNPFNYVTQLYPSVKRELVASQDGLIHKHIIANGWQVAFPTYPKAFHFGAVSGANRPGKRFTGSIASKKGQLLNTCFDAGVLKAYMQTHGIPLQPYFYDSIPVDMVQPAVTTLEARL